MDIYDVHEDLVKALCKMQKTKQYSDEFNKIETNHGKVNSIENLLVSYQQIPKLELRVELKVNKNNDKSLEYRKEGNKFYSLQNKDYFKAMELYNKSICFAEEDSENVAIGYANRSAILFEWKRYRECLENIRMAKDAHYPDRLMHKLVEREKKCLELIDTQMKDEPIREFQLVSEAHSKVPFIADCLAMKSNDDEGRFIYTQKELSPGDLVAIEDPFCTILLPSMQYIRCANCTRENYLTLIHCPNCTCAMFCSKKCLDDAYETFHKYECPIINFLFSLFNKIHLIALRVSLVALSLFENVEDLEVYCEQATNQDKCSFDLNYNVFSKLEHYRAIHGLVTNQDKRKTADLSQRCVIAAVLKRFLTQRTPLKDVLHSEKLVNLFTDLLFRHLQTAPSNMHGICLIETGNENNDYFASGAFPFASLLNHSCVPNTVRIYRGTKLHLFVLRPIPAGGVLYDNYGYHFAIQPKSVRLKNLDTQYRFQCKCDACENNYPLFHDLVAHPKVPDIIKSVDIYSLMEFNRKFAEDNFERYVGFLKMYRKYYPCAQISSTEESFKMVLNILMDSIPLRSKVAKL